MKYLGLTLLAVLGIVELVVRLVILAALVASIVGLVVLAILADSDEVPTLVKPILLSAVAKELGQ